MSSKAKSGVSVASIMEIPGMIWRQKQDNLWLLLLLLPTVGGKRE